MLMWLSAIAFASWILSVAVLFIWAVNAFIDRPEGWRFKAIARGVAAILWLTFPVALPDGFLFPVDSHRQQRCLEGHQEWRQSKGRVKVWVCDRWSPVETP